MRDLITYRYPRTLIEAFGCDARSAIAVHGPYRAPSLTRFVLKVSLVMMVVIVLGVFFQGV